jgi:hypothetical protein
MRGAGRTIEDRFRDSEAKRVCLERDLEVARAEIQTLRASRDLWLRAACAATPAYRVPPTR